LLLDSKATKRAKPKPAARGEDCTRARRLILQCVVAMFAEDIGLLAKVDDDTAHSKLCAEQQQN